MPAIDFKSIYESFGPGLGVIVVALMVLPAIIVPIMNRERKKPTDPLADVQASLISMARQIDANKVDGAKDLAEARKGLADFIGSIEKEIHQQDRRIMRLEAKEEAAREAWRARIEQTTPPHR